MKRSILLLISLCFCVHLTAQLTVPAPISSWKIGLVGGVNYSSWEEDDSNRMLDFKYGGLLGMSINYRHEKDVYYQADIILDQKGYSDHAFYYLNLNLTFRHDISKFHIYYGGYISRYLGMHKPSISDKRDYAEIKDFDKGFILGLGYFLWDKELLVDMSFSKGDTIFKTSGKYPFLYENVVFTLKLTYLLTDW